MIFVITFQKRKNGNDVNVMNTLETKALDEFLI